MGGSVIAPSTSTTALKWWIAVEPRRLREKAGLHRDLTIMRREDAVAALAEAGNWHKATFSGMENGRSQPAVGRAAARQGFDDDAAPILPSCPAHSRSRRTNFWTLPVDVFGSGPNSIASGHL
jgi:hypothetical protein